MIYLGKPHLVMLRVPKTGTHAWRDALAQDTTFMIDEPPAEKHLVLDQYLTHFHRALTEARGTPPEIMLCFREPISWVNSWYRYRYLPLHSPWADNRPLTRSSFDMSFEAFVQHFIAQSGHPAVDIGSQSVFLETKKPLPRLHIFQYEQIDKMRVFLEERMGKKLFLPRINSAQSGDTALSNALKQALLEHLAQDQSTWSNSFRL